MSSSTNLFDRVFLSKKKKKKKKLAVDRPILMNENIERFLFFFFTRFLDFLWIFALLSRGRSIGWLGFREERRRKLLSRRFEDFRGLIIKLSEMMGVFGVNVKSMFA